MVDKSPSMDKDRIVRDMIEVLKDPEVALLIADSMKKHCPEIRDIGLRSLVWLDPTPESLQIIGDEIEKGVPGLSIANKAKFEQLNTAIASAHLDKESIKQEAITAYMPLAPQVVKDAGPYCFTP